MRVIQFACLSIILTMTSHASNWIRSDIAPTEKHPYRTVVFSNPNPIKYLPLKTNLKPVKTSFEERDGYHTRRDVVSWTGGYYEGRTDDFTVYEQKQVDAQNNAIPRSWRRFFWGSVQQNLWDIYPFIGQITIQGKYSERDSFSVDPFSPSGEPNPVRILNIHAKGISSFEGSLHILSNLVELNLDSCSFAKSINFLPLQNLKHLSMRNNDLTVFPADLPASLCTIDFAINRIGDCTDKFKPELFPSLKTIGLAQNSIDNKSNVIKVLAHIPHLQALELHGNILTQFDDDSLNLLSKDVLITANAYVTLSPNVQAVTWTFVPSPQTYVEMNTKPSWLAYSTCPPSLTLPQKLLCSAQNQYKDIGGLWLRGSHGFLGFCQSEPYRYDRQ